MLVLLCFKNTIFCLKTSRATVKIAQVNSLFSLQVLVFYEFLGDGFVFAFYQKQIHAAFQQANV